MKKFVSLIFVALISFSVFSQSVLDKPEYIHTEEKNFFVKIENPNQVEEAGLKIIEHYFGGVPFSGVHYTEDKWNDGSKTRYRYKYFNERNQDLGYITVDYIVHDDGFTEFIVTYKGNNRKPRYHVYNDSFDLYY